MLGARRGRFYHNGVEIHDIVGVMREMTENKTCHICGENPAGAAMLITKKEEVVQDAPVVPVCSECMGSRESIDWLHERMDAEMAEGKLDELPSIKVEPALIVRTDKPPEIVETAMKVLGDAVVQDGSRFEIVEEDHMWFLKPDGTASFHYFRESGFLMMVEQDGKLVDGIVYFNKPGWHDLHHMMTLIHQSTYSTTPKGVEDMVEWVKELIWWRLQDEIQKQRRPNPLRLLEMLGSVIPPTSEDCDCPSCQARRVEGGEKAPESETIH